MNDYTVGERPGRTDPVLMASDRLRAGDKLKGLGLW